MSSDKLAEAKEFRERVKVLFLHFLGKERGGPAWIVKQTGLGAGTISQWLSEKDPKTPDASSLRLISDKLKINFEWLAWGKGEMLPDPVSQDSGMVGEAPVKYTVKPRHWIEAVGIVDGAIKARGLEKKITFDDRELLVSLFVPGVATGLPPAELQAQLIRIIDLIQAKMQRREPG